MITPLLLMALWQADTARCAPATGDMSVQVTPTTLQRSGSGGAGSGARQFFDLASNNSPIVLIELRAISQASDGGTPVLLAHIDGQNLGAVPGIKFTLPAPASYTLTVYAKNEYGCSREANTGRVLVVAPPVKPPPPEVDYCPAPLTHAAVTGWEVDTPFEVDEPLAILLLRGVPTDYPLNTHLITTLETAAFTSYDVVDNTEAFWQLLKAGHAPFVYEQVQPGTLDAGVVLVHSDSSKHWWINALVRIFGPDCGGGETLPNSCKYMYTDWRDIGTACPFGWTDIPKNP